MNRKTALILSLIGIFVIAAGFVLVSQLRPMGNFGIYLSENGRLVISDEDIVWYNGTSHEVRLTKRGAEKIEVLHVSLYGSLFIVKIDAEIVYNGMFVTPMSSIPIPPTEVVIETIVHNNTISIQNGYPPSL